MLILGLNMFHADASAAILQDGEIAFAIAEERLNRIKHYAGFPALAIQACLDAVGARISDVDHVAIGQDKDANLAKKIEYAVANPDKLLNFLQLRRRKQQLAVVGVAAQAAGDREDLHLDHTLVRNSSAVTLTSSARAGWPLGKGLFHSSP